MSEHERIWEDEPDGLVFMYMDLWCVVWRHPGFGHLNGYVGVLSGHPLYGKSYTAALCTHDGCVKHRIDTMFNAHGGVTFSGYLDVKDLSVPGGLWFFGFDTGHLGDYCPRYPDLARPGDEYRDVGYVIRETVRLARQLAKYKPVEVAEK